MVLARKALADVGGKITMSRLNRREYQNTIKALTGTTLDVELLPSDESAGRFDTIGSSQFLSSDQFEIYLKLGRVAIDEMFNRHSAAKVKSKIIRVEPEKEFNPLIDKFIQKKEETYAQFRKWQKIVDKIAKYTKNKKIVEAIYKQSLRTKNSLVNTLSIKMPLNLKRPPITKISALRKPGTLQQHTAFSRPRRILPSTNILPLYRNGTLALT